MSCPYTSQQNGRAERTLRTINNIVRSLLFQASLPPVYWADSLHTATYLLNRHPTKTLDGRTPHFALHGTQPTYTHLRVFGCACYPNLSSTASHKLSPRSSLCVFLGYSSDHKGYRCLDLHSNRIIISRHVVFDEAVFPFADMSTSPQDPTTLDFLDNADDSSSPHGSRAVHAGLRLPGGMDAAPGTLGDRAHTPPPGSPPACAAASPQPPAASPLTGAAAPADASSQAAASSAGDPLDTLPVLLPLWTLRLRPLPVAQVATLDVLLPRSLRQSPPSPTRTACAPERRKGSIFLLIASLCMQRHCLPCHPLSDRLCRTLLGATLCRMSSMPCKQTIHGPWFLARLVSI
jgi:hypothetical protein